MSKCHSILISSVTIKFPVNEEEKRKALQYLQTISTDVDIDDTGNIKTNETRQRKIYFSVTYFAE